MARGVLAALMAATALGIIGPAAAAQLPILRSAKVVRGHVVIRVYVDDVRPTELTVAKRRAVDAAGALLTKNVRLQETIRLAASATGVVRWRSHGRLRPGTFFVQVMAVDTSGVTDCPPKMSNCGQHFSNIRRVVVRRSRT